MYFRNKERTMLGKANPRRVIDVSRNCSLKTVSDLMCHPIKKVLIFFQTKNNYPCI